MDPAGGQTRLCEGCHTISTLCHVAPRGLKWHHVAMLWSSLIYSQPRSDPPIPLNWWASLLVCFMLQLCASWVCLPCVTGTWRCNRCSTKCTQLRRIFNQWPTPEFNKLSEDTCKRVDTHPKQIGAIAHLSDLGTHSCHGPSSVLAKATLSLTPSQLSRPLVLATWSLTPPSP